MSRLNRFFIFCSMWKIRIIGGFLLGSIPSLRKSAGAGSPIQIREGLRWEDIHANNVRCEWIDPPNARSDAALLYLHGGGGVLGLYNTHRKMVGYIASVCNLRSLIPDYKLAPENPFPAGLNDCLAAYNWLLTQGFNPGRIVIAGDSAGGHLTLSCLIALRDAGLPLPAAAFCISPNTDPTCSGQSMKKNARRDAFLSPNFAKTMMHHYVNNHDLSDPHLSPLLADLHGLPPILIHAGANELLLNDSTRFNDRAKNAGVNVTLDIWPNMWHDWHSCVPSLLEANQAIDQIGKFVKEHI
jgi:monoterpene epsilon-lactone hydrolase